jgi:hypothetical protein
VSIYLDRTWIGNLFSRHLRAIYASDLSAKTQATAAIFALALPQQIETVTLLVMTVKEPR